MHRTKEVTGEIQQFVVRRAHALFPSALTAVFLLQPLFSDLLSNELITKQYRRQAGVLCYLPCYPVWR
jgi:hypothetical protein